ncbi:MAG: GtrA family protein [Halanaerobiales bacterium]|nr:GtrA family protein [Halanaerobiales bacterium]
MNKDDIIKFIKFSVVGVSNTLVSLVSFYVFFEVIGIYYIIASTLGYIVGLINSYFGNLRWTFKQKHSIDVLIKFIIVNIVALGLKLSVIYILVESLQIPELYSEVIAMGFAIVVNFGGNRFWTFQE